MNIVRQKWSPKNRTARPAVFLDRDGTIIRFRSKIAHTGHIRPYQGAAQALQQLQRQGYLLIVVTNRPDIEKGLVSSEEVTTMNEYMHQLFARDGVAIDAIYSCPHRYESKCACRKPEIGLIHAAQKDFTIDLKKSWFVGDTTRDMETGKRAKLKAIRLKTGDRRASLMMFPSKGDFQAANLKAVVRIITSSRNR